MNEKTSQNQAQQLKSHERGKYLGSLSFKLLGTILKIDKGGTQGNGLKVKKVDDYA